MRFDPEKYHRRSIRLQYYDYASPGYYFVTVCCHYRECLLGDVVGGAMKLNEYGRVVQLAWQWLDEQYDHVGLDTFIVMPNHLHGIIILTGESRGDSRCRDDSRIAPTNKRKPIGRLVGAFKTVSTKQINKIRNTPGERVWQRNYYEHVVRDENELKKIREYIINNSCKWEMDRNHPDNIKM